MIEALIHNPVALIFGSYGLGVMATHLLKAIGKFHLFEDNNYISDSLTKKLGVLHFGWLIRHSFMGMFNPKLKYIGKANKEKLQQMIVDMTYAENNHLMGFVLLLLVNIAIVFMGAAGWYIIVLFLLNIVFNLYLVFLQQYNKRRINRLLQQL